MYTYRFSVYLPSQGACVPVIINADNSTFAIQLLEAQYGVGNVRDWDIL